MDLASGSILGSVVIIPEVSFQNHISSASIAAPISEADRSEPPLPKVVTVPFSSLAMKPVTTGTPFKGSSLWGIWL